MFPADKSGDMRLNNLPVIRLSEVYLNAAEAATKLGDNATAAKYLNVIAKRANPNAATINETVIRYTSETDKGFHYSLDPESQKFDRTYFRAILPIPASETDANPSIAKQQNPSY